LVAAQADHREVRALHEAGRIVVVQSRPCQVDGERGRRATTSLDLEVTPCVQGQAGAKVSGLARAVDHKLTIACAEQLEHLIATVHQRNQWQTGRERRLAPDADV
jgi:hypothetical protein